MGFANRMACRFWNQQLEIIRSRGILNKNEKVEAIVGLYKRNQLVFLLGILARFLQKQYLLIVAENRVLLVHIPAFLLHGGGYYQFAAADRPCRIELPGPPKEEYHIGCQVTLPEELSPVVGRQYAFVVFGFDAEKAFGLATQPGPERMVDQSRRQKSSCTPTSTMVQVSRPPVQTAPLQTEYIRFSCPDCSKPLKVNVMLAGKRVRCTRTTCASVIEVPVTHL